MKIILKNKFKIDNISYENKNNNYLKTENKFIIPSEKNKKSNKINKLVSINKVNSKLNNNIRLEIMKKIKKKKKKKKIHMIKIKVQLIHKKRY